MLDCSPLHSGPWPVSSPSLAGTRLAPSTLSDAELRALDSEALTVRALRANSDMIRMGHASDQLFVMLEGWACRYKLTGEGSRQIVALLVPGDVVNLDAVMLGDPGYEVRTLSAAKVGAIPCDRLRQLADTHVGIAWMLARLAAVENAVLSEWALCLGRQSAKSRLMHLLCELAVRVVGDEPDRTSFDLPMTQEQLGDVLGLTAVHVNRSLRELRDQGMITMAGRTVTIANVPAARQAAEFDPAYLHLGAGAMAAA